MEENSIQKDEFVFRRKLAYRVHKEWEDWKNDITQKIITGEVSAEKLDFLFFVGGIFQSFNAIFCGDDDAYLKQDNFESIPTTEFLSKVLLSSKESIIMRFYIAYMKSEVSVRTPLREVVRATVIEYFESEKNSIK